MFDKGRLPKGPFFAHRGFGTRASDASSKAAPSLLPTPAPLLNPVQDNIELGRNRTCIAANH